VSIQTAGINGGRFSWVGHRRKESHTGADAQFGALREVEITLEIPYTRDLPTKCNRFGIPEKNRYRTGDLCPLLGIHADTLRWRFKTGKYPEVARDGKGRLFALADLERIIAITKNFPHSRNPKQEVSLPKATKLYPSAGRIPSS
jgi:hypothetical protein